MKRNLGSLVNSNVTSQAAVDNDTGRARHCEDENQRHLKDGIF